MGAVRTRRTRQAADGGRLPHRPGGRVPAVETRQRIPRDPRAFARRQMTARTLFGWLAAAVVALTASTAAAQTRPNIVIIMTDDLGYGDVSSYGATALQTPNIDRLAKEGLRFTDAHSSAATCTPSRYALLT